MRILILEDDRATAQLLGLLLTSSGHTIVHALDGTEGLKQLRGTPCDLVISDVQMVPMDGFEFLATARAEFPRLLVVLASACADLHVRIEQHAHKPFDVVHKPFRIEEVRRVLGRAEEALAVQASVARAPAGAGSRDAGGAAPDAAAAGLARLYPGPAYAQARAGLLRAMAHAGNALLVAEPGVLPAELLELWRGAAGSGAPWRVADVGRDAEAARTLLFGAHGAGPVVETARGGTLVVLHVEGLSLEEQGHLLAHLRSQPPTRLIASVWRDPDLLLEQGVMDEALYFRLSSLTVTLPSLSARADQLDALFVDALRATPAYPFGATDVQIEPVALSALRAHPWPENFLELRSVAAWTAARMRGPRVTLSHLPERFHRARLATLSEALGSAQREHLERALRLCPSKREAASAMGIGLDEFEAGVDPSGPLLFSIGSRTAPEPTATGPAAASHKRHPSILFVSADEELRFAAEAQFSGLGLEARIAADGLQAVAEMVLSLHRPRIAILAGPTAPFDDLELAQQLRRLAPGLVVAQVGTGQESEDIHSFPALESMDLFPVMIAHLLEAASKA